MGWFMNAVHWVDSQIEKLFGGTGDAKLLQGLEIVLVVLHKRLAGHFRGKYPSEGRELPDQLATAVLNHLLARGKPGSQAARFAKDNRRLVKQALRELAEEVPELCREITLALYVREILDSSGKGTAPETRSLFERATKLGVFSPEVTILQPKEYFKHALALARGSGLLPE
ncbi:MAG: hypothetical protein U9P14_03655 [Gemmatimonadota bacterium]|nr:hypothetical protein [Gemmatimonadota bacterium]